MNTYRDDLFGSAASQLMHVYRKKTIAVKSKNSPVLVAHTDKEAMQLAHDGYLILFCYY